MQQAEAPKAPPGDATRTALVYDTRLLAHRNVHERGEHPESPERIRAIFQKLREAGLVEQCMRLSAREATAAELLAAHDAGYHETLTATAELPYEALAATARRFNSVYLSNESAFCGRLSCGGVVEACRAVWTGAAANALCVVRPPGHHAEPGEAMGFCLYNNVAVAARALQRQHGARRLLIVDWDIHHGNGTQRIFYDDPGVLYVSIHRHDDGRFYPCSPEAGVEFSGGSGAAAGRNVNIPWPSAGFGDADYLHAFHRVVLPIAHEFDPELVIVSAGFDAADGDHIGRCHVTPAGFAQLAHLLAGLAGGRLVVALEGGYNVEATAQCMTAVARVIVAGASSPPPRLDGPQRPSARAIETIHSVLEVHSRYWTSLAPIVKPCAPNLASDPVATIPAALALRTWRLATLAQKAGLQEAPLPPDAPQDAALAVAAPPGQPDILVLVHSVPQLVAFLRARDNIARLDDSSIVDATLPLVLRASGAGLAIVDFTIPANAPPAGRRAVAERLLRHVWTNNVANSPSARIAVVAVGPDAAAIVQFLLGDAVRRSRVAAVAVLCPDAQPPNARGLDDAWYAERSFVVTPCDTQPRGSSLRLPRSYGRCVAAGVAHTAYDVNELLVEFADDIWSFIMRQFAALPVGRPASPQRSALRRDVLVVKSEGLSAVSADDLDIGRRSRRSPQPSPSRRPIVVEPFKRARSASADAAPRSAPSVPVDGSPGKRARRQSQSPARA